MSEIKVDKVSPQSGTALEIGDSGDTVTVPSGATLDISDATLTPPATMPASSGANLTSLPAGNLTGTVADARISTLTASKLSGIVPTANLGTGTANADTFLNGRGAYSAAGGAWAVKGSETSFSSVTSLEVGSFTKTTRIILKSITFSLDNAYVRVTVSNDGGSSYSSTAYYHWAKGWDSNGSASDNYGANDAGASISPIHGNAANRNGFYDATIYDPQLTLFTHIKMTAHSVNPDGRLALREGGIVHEIASAVTHIKFNPTTGAFSGTYIMLELN